MKLRITLTAVAVLLGTGWALSQDTGGSTDRKIKTTASGKKATKTKVYHKGKTASGGAQGTGHTTNPAPDLNPQPLPPGRHAANPADAASKDALKLQLNPQPLPPGARADASEAHKGGKKSKKGSAGGTTTTTPK